MEDTALGRANVCAGDHKEGVGRRLWFSPDLHLSNFLPHLISTPFPLLPSPFPTRVLPSRWCISLDLNGKTEINSSTQWRECIFCGALVTQMLEEPRAKWRGEAISRGHCHLSSWTEREEELLTQPGSGGHRRQLGPWWPREQELGDSCSRQEDRGCPLLLPS